MNFVANLPNFNVTSRAKMSRIHAATTTTTFRAGSRNSLTRAHQGLGHIRTLFPDNVAWKWLGYFYGRSAETGQGAAQIGAAWSCIGSPAYYLAFP
jgi:hypothetical protein